MSEFEVIVVIGGFVICWIAAVTATVVKRDA